MRPYREFQFGWVLVVTAVIILALSSYVFIFNVGTKPMELWSFLLVTGMMGLATALMYGMSTEVGNGIIRVSFGIGLINRSINLNDVKEVAIVRNPWYYGWGVRLIPNGWLYNITGSDAVEVKLNNSNRIVRIGSRNSKHLADEIGKQVAKMGKPENR